MSVQSGSKKHFKTIVIAAVIAAVLTAAFFFTGSPAKDDKGTVRNSTVLSSSGNESKTVYSRYESMQSSRASSDMSTDEISDKPDSSIPESTSEPVSSIVSYPEQEPSPKLPHPPETDVIAEQTSVLQETESVSEKSESIVPESIQPSLPSGTVSAEQDEPAIQPQEPESPPDAAEYCTVSISCETLLDNMDSLKKNKRSLVPSDGVILAPVKAELQDGDSVFDVSKRLCMEMRIPFEFTLTPVYNTAYIEGIYNLYEFDCGSGSGWIYTVNGVKPSVGCSDYPVHSGDSVEWHYTCSLGNDISGVQEG